jgi:hypothetical protein
MRSVTALTRPVRARRWPFASKAACVSGMRPAHSSSIRSAHISISRWGNDGNREPSRAVRSDKKFISDRAFIVTYIDE